MKAISPIGLRFAFTETQKACMLNILGKYTGAPAHHEEVANRLKVDGETVLWKEQAVYLAGVIYPYYSFLTVRILAHPCLQNLDDATEVV